METKYSKKEFAGYTHRFIVQFEIGEPYSHSITIYSNNGDEDDLIEFIENNATKKVKSFKVAHRATKEHDDLSNQLINEVLAGI